VSKTTMIAFAAALVASMPMAIAQTAKTTDERPATLVDRAAVTSNHLMPGQIRVTDMDGATVYDTSNKNIGDIKDIILDKDGRVAAVVLNVGSSLGIGGRLVAVTMNDLRVTQDSNNKPRFTVDRTEDQLKSAQTFSLNSPATSTGSSTPPAAKERGREIVQYGVHRPGGL
jgi:sporulation protein YlmC with PRC-barrel domain